MDAKTRTASTEEPKAALPARPSGQAAPDAPAAQPTRAQGGSLLSKLRDRLQKRIRGRSKQGANIYPLY